MTQIFIINQIRIIKLIIRITKTNQRVFVLCKLNSMFTQRRDRTCRGSTLLLPLGDRKPRVS